jgi:hypothetical protein
MRRLTPAVALLLLVLMAPTAPLAAATTVPATTSSVELNLSALVRWIAGWPAGWRRFWQGASIDCGAAPNPDGSCSH